MANFTSDNCAPAHPDILAALSGPHGMSASYGGDALTQALESRLSALFDTSIILAIVSTGTAANSLALSLYTPPYGAIFCHAFAHILADEYGAPGLFTGGAQLLPVGGAHGKIDPVLLKAAIVRASHQSLKPCMLSLTQPTESGTLYTSSELAELCGIAHNAGLKVHMDGARFACAIAASTLSPAQMSWQAGVDVLTFGATKNGCINAESVIVFNDDQVLREALHLRRKQSGHTLSKMRYTASQFMAYLDNNHWLGWAEHANRMAASFAAFMATRGFTPEHPVQTNQLFYQLPAETIQRLRENGHQFLDWHDGSVRFVTSYATREEDIEELADAL